MDDLAVLLSDYTLRTVALGAGLLGAYAGGLGAFAVLRRQSLLGDAVSHAALPGIALAFLLTGSKAPLVLLLGAAGAGWLGTLLVMAVMRASHLKADAAMGLVLSVFFGLGLVLLTLIQKRPDAAQAGLSTYLFGQATALAERDVWVLAGLFGVTALLLALGWKEVKLLAFDEAFGRSLGLPTRALDVALTAALVVAIVAGLQTVGVVLMSALVVAPAAAARQWTDRLGPMVGLAAAFGALAGVLGAFASGATTHVPTGPAIVVVISVLVLVSLLFAPNRGVLWEAARRALTRRRLSAERVLCDVYELALQHDDTTHPHETGTLKVMTAPSRGVRRCLVELARRGLVQTLSGDRWALTAEGEARAVDVLRARGVLP